MILKEFLSETGLKEEDVKSKALRLGMNINGYLSKQNIEDLSTIYFLDYMIKPSKINIK